jgi:hypothetical protein
MEKTIIKNIRGLILITGVALAIVSCRKEQNTGFKTSPGDAQVTTNLKDANAIPVVCAGTIPDSLQVPAGNRFVLQAYAKGVQIYQVRRSATDPTVFLWVNIAPSATLYARPDFTNQVAIHYAGPTWEFTKGAYKGEKVVGTKLKGFTSDVTAIPWLLLKAVDSLSSAGNKVTYIQRICTAGGLPPATIPVEEQLGKLDSIPYTASYLFYEAKN